MSDPAPTPANPSPAAPIPRWRKYLRRGMLAGAGLLILLLAVFFMLPVWISNQQGRLYVLDRLNDRLHGPKVQVDAWQLGWFRNTELTNLRILAPDGTTILTCPHVTSGLTLWDIFWSNYDIRNTTADQLELHINKYTDGSTSLDSLAQKDGAAGDILRSARGALQINDGKIVVYSARSNQTLNYHNAKATVSVASSEAPFHVEIKAVGAAGESISVSGTFPPTSGLSPRSFLPQNIWTLAGDVDFSANQVPAGLACDFLGVDDAWVDSLSPDSPALEYIQFSGHAPAVLPPNHPDALHLSLQVKGAARGGEAATLDARMLLFPPAGGASGQLLVASSDGISLALRQSPPLAKLLGRLNPLLGEISPTHVGLVHANVMGLSLALDHPEKAQATLRLTFPPMLFATHDGPSLLRQLQVALGETPRPNSRLEGGAEPMQARLFNGQFNYQNFVVTLGSRRIAFSGGVSLDGQLDLAAQIPDKSSGLAVSYTQVVITGTIDTPLLKRAE